MMHPELDGPNEEPILWPPYRSDEWFECAEEAGMTIEDLEEERVLILQNAARDVTFLGREDKPSRLRRIIVFLIVLPMLIVFFALILTQRLLQALK